MAVKRIYNGQHVFDLKSLKKELEKQEVASRAVMDMILEMDPSIKDEDDDVEEMIHMGPNAMRASDIKFDDVSQDYYVEIDEETEKIVR